MLHQVSQPRGARSGAKLKEWSKHWQVGEEVQAQDKLWESKVLRNREQPLPPMKVRVQREAAAA